MEFRFLLDNNIVLDILLRRLEDNPRALYIYEWFIENKQPIYLASSQIPTINYVFFSGIKQKRSDRAQAKTQRDVFLGQATILKTPAYIDFMHPMARVDIEGG
jgi:hypothetical protein